MDNINNDKVSIYFDLIPTATYFLEDLQLTILKH